MTPYKEDAWEKQNLILQGTWAWHLDGIPDVAGATEKTPECFFGDGKKLRHGPFHFPLFGGIFTLQKNYNFRIFEKKKCMGCIT